MRRFGWARWALLGVTLATVSCTRAAQQQDVAAEARREILPPLEGTGLAAAAPERAAAGPTRRVGDYLVQRFSGTFRERPFTLVEEVIGQEGALLVVDFRLEQGDEKRALRVRFDAETERVLAVSHLRGADEIPTGLAEYERLMALTRFSPDSNEGALGVRSQTCIVGPRELDCEQERFRVLVDEQEAVLVVDRSAELGRDVAGEIRAVDGTILYRTELVGLREGGHSLEAEASLGSSPWPPGPQRD